MERLEKGLIRMELQVGQLIRIVANMSERLEQLEKQEQGRKMVSLHTKRVREPMP
ncbi:hypothetical protein NCCP2222_33750 [Sporosarcina sp. NCCP-2222]|uniref:hypothetical protein n=1 Tax=Sporosarcina sp. NCCP-2222 TaxID=2935073 RepID=UPI00208C2E77|nr:hypothetical protein [Sporosarcina sp. NCCP-2222]GKV57428.1 hypothetical protein NCCP2222_33750 [Sporosarcina sp. NCCP-2222]